MSAPTRAKSGTNRLRALLRRIPVHVVLIVLCVLWILPAFGLLVTSFRPVQDVNESGWWAIFGPPKGAPEYAQFCSSCHGADGKAIGKADLTSQAVTQSFARSSQLIAMLKEPIAGQPHMGSAALPNDLQAAAIAQYLGVLSGTRSATRVTIDNYVDALVGYTGTATYTSDCAQGKHSVDLSCTAGDVANPRGMGQAFVNSLIVAIPSTLLPILFASFAAYAMSWMHFRGRQWLFALLVGLQVVPLQMTLIPISKLYAQLGMNGTFVGIWLFHTGFGLPYAIYLMRNFLGSLPREIFESVYLDGASHWTAFTRLAIPLAMPAIASLGIFQFLWIWNDLLVALVFLGGDKPVLTYRISTLVTSLGGGWQLLTAAAFISMALPMLVFLSLQRYFVRGLLAGSVKG